MQAKDKAKPALVMLHGVGGHAEAHVRHLQAHSEYFSFWAIDMVGHGATDRATTGLEIPNYIERLLDLFAVAESSAHFTGESLGGWVALRLAADHPEKLDRLVLNTADPCRWCTLEDGRPDRS